MKQETLEEAGVAYAKTVNENHTSHMLGFYNGAKWQQEKMYSEDEVLDFAEWRDKYIDGLFINKHTTKELLQIWFEKFKKNDNSA